MTHSNRTICQPSPFFKIIFFHDIIFLPTLRTLLPYHLIFCQVDTPYCWSILTSLFDIIPWRTNTQTKRERMPLPARRPHAIPCHTSLDIYWNTTFTFTNFSFFLGKDKFCTAWRFRVLSGLVTFVLFVKSLLAVFCQSTIGFWSKFIFQATFWLCQKFTGVLARHLASAVLMKGYKFLSPFCHKNMSCL